MSCKNLDLVCSRCGATDRNPSGRCRPCQAERSATYYAANRESMIARAATYYAANRESMAAGDRVRYLRQTVHAYDALLAGQGGVCATCGAAPSPNRRLSVDHDHETGAIRGLLCDLCNRALGHAKDDPARLRALANYLESSSI